MMMSSSTSTMTDSGSNGFVPTPYKVSTITSNGSINSFIDLRVLFQHAPILSVADAACGIVYIEFGSNKNELTARGVPPKKKQKKKLAAIMEAKEREHERAEQVAAGLLAKDVADEEAAEEKKFKRFDNQATVIIKMDVEGNYFINMKIFKNGVVQMTGVKHMDHGKRAVDIFIDVIKGMCAHNIAVVEEPGNLLNTEYKIRLINSDFRLMDKVNPEVGFEVRREVLHRILVEKMNNKCTYEPCIYQGVKLQYFWNSAYPVQTGNCVCPRGHCNGKGTGHAINLCKKITIAVFQSGCVLITGSANSHEQIEDCYQYICRIIRDHADLIKKKRLIPLMPAKPTPAKKTAAPKPSTPKAQTQPTADPRALETKKASINPALLTNHKVWCQFHSLTFA